MEIIGNPVPRAMEAVEIHAYNDNGHQPKLTHCAFKDRLFEAMSFGD
jgi:hypothetical protein